MRVRTLVLATILGGAIAGGAPAAEPAPIERLRAFAGDWQLVDSDDEPTGMRATYRVVAAGAAVVEESKAPPRRIPSPVDFEKKLGGGEFGAVVERIVGGRWAEHAISVDWDLSRFAGKQMRLYVVDAVSNHFGQIAVSEISITEDAPR